ncbi:MAG: branched-chain amino acid ABC transporter permease [Acidimicrobiales bacterium]|nr:branched-chain amino acid ABC transporter permease [Acidimicrobiales bacterium]
MLIAALVAQVDNKFSEFLQFFFLGLGKGAVYATIALALVIIFRVSGMLNFAQGEMAMVSTYVTWGLWTKGLPLVAALILAMVLSFLGGAAIERVVIRPIERKARGNPLPVVIATIGLFLALNGAAPWIWDAEAKQFPYVFGSGSVSIAGASISTQTLGTLAVLVVEVALLWLLFQKTKVGLAMRGVASNSQSSALVGVPVGRMLMLGWGLAAAMGAVAGVLTVSLAFDNSLMAVPLIYAFAAATLGGFDSPVGAVVGGLTVGVVAELSAAYVGFIGEPLRLLPAFVLILVVLLVRPQGLFGKAQVSRV